MHDVPESSPMFQLKFQKPHFDTKEEFTFYTGTYDLFLNMPLTSKYNIEANIPYAIGQLKDNDDDAIDNFGNIYLGLQSRISKNANKTSILSLGVNLPTTSDNMKDISATFISILTNPTKMIKYYPNTFGLYTNYAKHIKNNNGSVFGFELGPEVFVPTGDNDNDVELLAHYGLKAGLNVRKVTLFSELVGVVYLSEDFNEFGDRFLETVSIGGQWNGRNFKPGINIKRNLDDEITRTTDWILGFNFNYIF